MKSSSYIFTAAILALTGCSSDTDIQSDEEVTKVVEKAIVENPCDKFKTSNPKQLDILGLKLGSTQSEVELWLACEGGYKISNIRVQDQYSLEWDYVARKQNASVSETIKIRLAGNKQRRVWYFKRYVRYRNTLPPYQRTVDDVIQKYGVGLTEKKQYGAFYDGYGSIEIDDKSFEATGNATFTRNHKNNGLLSGMGITIESRKYGAEMYKKGELELVELKQQETNRANQTSSPDL